MTNFDLDKKYGERASFNVRSLRFIIIAEKIDKI